MRPDQGLEEQKQDSNNFSAFLGEGLSPPPPPPPILFHQCERKEKGKRRRKLLSGGKERKERKEGEKGKTSFSFLFSSRGLRPPAHHWCSLLHKASYSSYSSQAQAPDRGGGLSPSSLSPFQTHGRRTSLFAIVKWGGGGGRGGGLRSGWGGRDSLLSHPNKPPIPPLYFLWGGPLAALEAIDGGRRRWIMDRPLFGWTRPFSLGRLSIDSKGGDSDGTKKGGEGEDRKKKTRGGFGRAGFTVA